MTILSKQTSRPASTLPPSYVTHVQHTAAPHSAVATSPRLVTIMTEYGDMPRMFHPGTSRKSDAPSTSPSPPSATTRIIDLTMPLGSRISVSNPLLNCCATTSTAGAGPSSSSSSSSSSPPDDLPSAFPSPTLLSTCHRTTSVAPFQLTYTVPPTMATLGGYAAGLPAQDPRNTRYELTGENSKKASAPNRASQSTSPPAENSVVAVGQVLHAALGLGPDVVRVVVRRAERHGVVLVVVVVVVAVAIAHVDVDDPAPGLPPRVADPVVVVVEEGDGPALLDPAGVVLPREVEGAPGARGGGGRRRRRDVDKVVDLAGAQGPEDVAGAALDVDDGPEVAGRDEVVAAGVLVDAVEVEVVKGRVAGVAAAGEARARVDAAVVLGLHGRLGREVRRRRPLEEQRPGLDVDLLEVAVLDPAVLGPADGPQVVRHGHGGDEQGRVVGRDVELVHVGVREPVRPHPVPHRVRLVQHVPGALQPVLVRAVHLEGEEGLAAVHLRLDVVLVDGGPRLPPDQPALAVEDDGPGLVDVVAPPAEQDVVLAAARVPPRELEQRRARVERLVLHRRRQPVQPEPVPREVVVQVQPAQDVPPQGRRAGPEGGHGGDDDDDPHGRRPEEPPAPVPAAGQHGGQCGPPGGGLHGFDVVLMMIRILIYKKDGRL
ncbi:hypothetical protein VSDG_04307 [Cytospora chrysosperma]|uniref:Uncharacterized protein n=1 Tax=Cytospora chrysosperma TaxID=252740 RepID=A0A423W5M8_CYTCH|nr:hypothetical protein VSDG_04307 [Valsa sordida]